MVTKATPESSSVRRVAVLLPLRAPPLDGDDDGSGGRRVWREGVMSRLARAASELGLPHHRDGDDSKNNGDVVMWKTLKMRGHEDLFCAQYHSTLSRTIKHHVMCLIHFLP